jgi:hypothetical protein
LKGLAAEEDRRQAMAETAGLEARIHDLKSRGAEALLELIETAIRNRDGGAAAP